jgi:hypothetical protein
MPSDAPIPSSPPAQTAPEAEHTRNAGVEPGESPAVDSPEQDVLTLDPDDYQPHPTEPQSPTP